MPETIEPHWINMERISGSPEVELIILETPDFKLSKFRCDPEDELLNMVHYLADALSKIVGSGATDVSLTLKNIYHEEVNPDSDNVFVRISAHRKAL